LKPGRGVESVEAKAQEGGIEDHAENGDSELKLAIAGAGGQCRRDNIEGGNNEL
jgi:hypothetical protein